MRVHELAKELDITSKEIVDFFAKQNIELKAQNSLSEEQVAEFKNAAKGDKKPAKKAEAPKAEEPKKEEIKAEEPKKEEVKAEEPKAEETKEEEPKKEEEAAPVKKKFFTNKAGGVYQNKLPEGERRVRPDGERRPRPDGERRPRPDGERRPRPDGERRPRPDGERRPRPDGERRPRPDGERRPRPDGERRPRPEGVKPEAAEVKKPEAPKTEAVRTEAPKAEPVRTEAPRAAEGERRPRPDGERRPRNEGFQNDSRRGGRDNRDRDGFKKDFDRDEERGRGQRRDDRRKSGFGDSLGQQINKQLGKMDMGMAQKPSSSDRKDRRKDNRNDDIDKFASKASRMAKNAKVSKNKQQVQAPTPKPAEKVEETIRTIVLEEKMTIKELADKMKVQASAIVKKLFLQGKMFTVNQEIDFEMAEEIALEFNCIAELAEKVDVIAELLKEDEESEDDMVPRAPVVCVMGHVDHGKTSLLDAIRDTNVTDKEAGGITQHIGAYTVSINGNKITFLDTPGHEAFTAMRMRGAKSTDIAILVVAADDGVMPQTVEAINHAKAAGVEIIVAINKIDKPSANIEKVKQELSEYELIPEDWGGSTVFVPVSAHTREGIENLLEMIILTSEILELKANPKRKARGLVIEAELDKGRGPVATVLIQKGTLKVGDAVASGKCHGKVRAMIDDKGRRVKEAGPATPVEILGLSDVPAAGEIFLATETEKEARNFAETFNSVGREKLIDETKQRMSLDDLYSQIQAGNLKELNIIVKADVQGSVEAVKQSLVKLSNEEVVVKVIHGGVGAINESDVILASASNAIIIGFNVRPDAVAKEIADREGVDLRLYKVIYNAIEDVEAAMKGMLDPVYEEKVIGHAEIRQLFKASGVGTIAGSYVLDGVFQRGCKVRITRAGEQIFEGNLASLKRFKDDVKEVKSNYECGLVFEDFNAIQELDIVEAYIMVEVER